jgi:Ca2+/Na+ antiporter
MGKAYVGLLLLAGATSLPEIATSITAAAIGNASLAVSNLLGGVAIQTVVLAVVDATQLRRALTFWVPQPVLLLQGVLLVLLLSLALGGTAAGEPLVVLGVGATTVLLAAVYVLGLHHAHRYVGHPRWRPIEPEEAAERPPVAGRSAANSGAPATDHDQADPPEQPQDVVAIGAAAKSRHATPQQPQQDELADVSTAGIGVRFAAASLTFSRRAGAWPGPETRWLRRPGLAAPSWAPRWWPSPAPCPS